MNNTKLVEKLASTKKREIRATITGSVLTIVHGEDKLVLDAMTLTPELQTYAMVHGIKQRIMDTGAVSKGATAAERFTMMGRTLGILRDEKVWSLRGEGGDNEGGLFFRAVCKMHSGLSPEKVAAWLDQMPKETILKMRAAPKYKMVMAELKLADDPDHAETVERLEAELERFCQK